MKYLRRSLTGLGLLLLAGGLLVWFLPARWVLPGIESRLHGLRLQQVQGLLWDGRAGQVLTADGRPLGQLHWQLSRRALLGQLRLHVDFEGPQFAFAGAMRQLSADQVEWRAVRLRAELQTLTARMSSPLGQPLGKLQMTVAHAVLQGGWPLQLQAQAQWQPAIVRTRAGDLSLGTLQLRAQAHSGVIVAQLHDDGQGPLQADGQLQLSPLGWRLEGTLRARQHDPALRHWLATLGPLEADGTVHIQRGGGLAGNLPSTPPITTEKPHEP